MPAFLLRAPGLVPSILPVMGEVSRQIAELSLRHHQSRYTKPPVHAWVTSIPRPLVLTFPSFHLGWERGLMQHEAVLSTV